MVKDKVQGDVPCNVNRHEARRNKANKSGRESRIHRTEVPQYRQRMPDAPHTHRHLRSGETAGLCGVHGCRTS